MAKATLRNGLNFSIQERQADFLDRKKTKRTKSPKIPTMCPLKRARILSQLPMLSPTMPSPTTPTTPSPTTPSLEKTKRN